MGWSESHGVAEVRGEAVVGRWSQVAKAFVVLRLRATKVEQAIQAANNNTNPAIIASPNNNRIAQ